jgi:hypothetical protein
MADLIDFKNILSSIYRWIWVIDYAEEEGQIIIHFSKDGEPVLLEILDAKDFILNSLSSVVKEKEVAIP